MSETVELAGRRHVRHGLSQKAVVCVVCAASSFMGIVDGTIVNVTVPTLGRQFHASPAEVDSVIIGYLVSMALLIPVSAWLGDKLGPRRVLLASIAAFTAASALCGAASTLAELTGFRIVQGAAAGLITPVGLAMLLRAVPVGERARVAGILVIPSSFAPALGPVLGGLFVTGLSWRWVFYVNVPVGVAVLLFGLLFLTEQEHPAAGAFDARGFVLACVGLPSLMYGLSEGPGQGWQSPWVIATLAVGAVFLGALVLAELRRPHPLIDVRLVADRLFRTSTAVMFLTAACYSGALYLVTLLYQYGLGMSALASGLNQTPEALGVVTGSLLGTRWLFPMLGPRRLIASGLAVLAVSTAALSTVTTGTDLWIVRLLLLVMGFSMSAVVPPTQTVAFTTLAPARIGRASAFFNAQRQAGGAIGVAVGATVVAAVGVTIATVGHPSTHLDGYHIAFLAVASMALLGSLVALTVKDEDAAATVAR